MAPAIGNSDTSGSDGDSVSVVQSRSWLQRIGQSVVGVLIGLLLIVGACALLFWNEGRAVTTARSLTEGAGLVRSVPADRIDPANEGRLVHVVGPLSASGPAIDGEFALKIAAVRLVRRVEMFQWIEESESETSKRLGGGDTTKTTYKYKRSWVDHPVDSSRFHDRQGHANPQMAWRGRQIVAPGVRLGAFAVPETLIDHFGSEKALPAGEEHVQAAQKRTGRPVQVIDGVLFVGRDADQPAVGDYRISYAEVPRQPATVVARQAGSGFEPYRTRAGGTVALIAAGEVPAAAMFQEAQDDNRILAWLLRGAGALAMLVGFALVMGPIGVIADVIPIIGDIVRLGAGLVALALTLVLAPLVIAVSWFWYRPVVAASVLVAGIVLSYGAVRFARVHKAAKPSTPPTPAAAC